MTDNERESVLGAFAVESHQDAATLKNYLRRYPQFAEDLVELSFLCASPDEDLAELTEHDRNRIDSAWAIVSARRTTADPFAELTSQRSQEICQALAIPRSALLALRDRLVIPATVPRHFLTALAQQLAVADDELRRALQASGAQLSRSFLSDRPPKRKPQVSFEQILREAGLDEDRIRKLLQN